MFESQETTRRNLLLTATKLPCAILAKANGTVHLAAGERYPFQKRTFGGLGATVGSVAIMGRVASQIDYSPHQITE